jgi:hypothetical protein
MISFPYKFLALQAQREGQKRKEVAFTRKGTTLPFLLYIYKKGNKLAFTWKAVLH